MKKTTALFLAAGLASIAIAQDPTLDQSRAELANMKADAANRTSLLAAGTEAGHDEKGFYMADGENFRLNVSGGIQFRYNMNFRDNDSTPGADDEFTHGFQTRRTKLEFWGNVINPNLHYKIQGAFDRDDSGSFNLEDAWVAYDFNENFTMTWGQFKLPYMREELVSYKYQLAADRSVMDETFNQDRSQGIQLEWHNDNFRLLGAFSDGFNSDNTDFTSGGEADFALTGRIEYNTVGDWARFKDFTSWRSADKIGLLFGGAGHWQSEGDTGGTGPYAGGGDADVWGLTADISVEGKGWNLFGALTWQATDIDAGSDTDDWGFVIQGGVFVTAKDEIFARWDSVLPDDSSGSGDDEFNTITAGWNHYFVEESHAAKLTVDILYYLDAQSDSSNLIARSNATGSGGGSNTGVNLLTDANDSQWGLRAQFQLLF